MKKVLYIGGFELPDRNAAAQRVISVGKTIREAGYEVEFIGVTKIASKIGKTYNFEGFSYVSRSYPQGLIDWFKYITKFISFNEIAKRQPDYVILYNFPSVAQGKIITYCHKKNIKVFADLTEWYQADGDSLHDMIKRFDVNNRMKRQNFRCDGIIAISQYLFHYYQKKVRTIYIPATVDLNDKKWHRNRLIEIHKPIKLVYAGSPGGKQKDRIDELVDSVRGKNEFVLNVFGITEQQYIKIYDSFYLSENNIIFHGRVSHQEAIKMVCNSDFQVIIRDNNLVTRAGFPTKFVESICCGIPVVATPSSNICDYLEDGINGFVINSQQSLRQCLEKIASLTESAILDMKKTVLNITTFDYRNYKNDIMTLFE